MKAGVKTKEKGAFAELAHKCLCWLHVEKTQTLVYTPS